MTPEKLIKRLNPTGLNSRFTQQHANFSGYIANIKQMQAKVNQDWQLGLTEEQLDAIAPFEQKPEIPNRKGMLLIHGLFDTPFIMRDLADYYVAQGFLVRSILLPGHGTIAADLLTTSPEEWYKATAYGVKSFVDEVDEIYITGFSTGAMLALHYCLETNKPPISKLILLSPVFAINTYENALVRIYRMFRWLFHKQKWVLRPEIIDYAKYASFPVNSAYLVQRVILETQQLLKSKPCDTPLLIVASEDDETVRTDVSLEFFKKTENPLNRFLLYTNTKYEFSDKRIQQHAAAKLEEYILDLSHTCIPIAPHNAHYGKNGTYEGLLLEPKKNINFSAQIYLGAVISKNVKTHRLRRITYNPFFAYMCVMISHFLG